MDANLDTFFKQPPMLNGKPTQAPLNREQQKHAFENLRNEYFKEPLPVPKINVGELKEYKLTESEQLRAVQVQMQERGMNQQVLKLDERLEEKKTQDIIKSFYCTHIFQTVKATWMVLPIKYKICKKCGLVK
jgi:predicted Zn-ribbon and HTH transcriptional regulator